MSRHFELTSRSANRGHRGGVPRVFRQLSSALAATALAAGFIIFAAPPSSAAPTCTSVAGFEIDGNLAPGDCGTLDWNNVPAVVTSTVGTYQTSNKDDSNPGNWTSAGGTPPKGDFITTYSYAQVSGGSYYAYVGWTRELNVGTGGYVIEIDNATVRQAADGTPQPDRSQGGTVFYITTHGNELPVLLQSCAFTSQPNYPGTCTTGTAGFVAAVNADGTFFEIGLNVTALTGVAPACPAASQASMYMRSFTGQNFGPTGNLKGWVGGAAIAPPTTCGDLRIRKEDPAHNLIAGATFQIAPNPLTGAGSLTVLDGGATDPDGTADGIVEFNQAQPGPYTITETAPPPGYIALTGPLPATVTTGNTATVIFTNRLGTVAWEKRSAVSNNLICCATFSVHRTAGLGSQPDLTVTDNNATDKLGTVSTGTDTNGADGVIAVAGLKTGSYTVTEIVSPLGYNLPALPSKTFTIGPNANNADVTLAASPFLDPQPRLTLTKVADATPVDVISPIGFTITAANGSASGTGAASNVVINDPLPAGSGVNWSISPAYVGPGTCAITGAVGSQVLHCVVGALAPGASASVHLASVTTFNSCGVYPNVATLTATEQPTLTAQTSITLRCPALTLTKTADAAVVSAGTPIGFTVHVASAGPATATGVLLHDPLPAGSDVNWSITPAYVGPGTCAITGAVGSQTLDCDLGTLAAATSANVHVTSATTFSSCKAYPNTATLTATNHPQLTAAATITVQCSNLSISKTADDPSVSGGSPIGFTITVGNAGTGAANSASLSDPLPTGNGVNWVISPAYAGPGTCSFTGIAPGVQTLNCSFGNLASGGSATVHVQSATVFASCAEYKNVATLSATNAPSLEANATTTVFCPNVALSKTADASTVDAGTGIGFTIAATNTGVGTAAAVTISDPLPAGSGVSWSISPSYAGPGNCAVTGSVGSQVLDCNFGDLGSGTGSSVHVISATSFASCSVYPNMVTLHATNFATLTAAASTTVQCPAVSLTKTADAGVVSAGSQIGFTVTASNSGTGNATGVVIDDPLPAGGAINWSLASGPASCSVTGAVGSQLLHCNVGTLASGVSVTAHVVSATTFRSCKLYSNTATLTGTNHPRLTAEADTTVQCPVVSVTKVADAAQVNAGSPIGFTINVANAGPGTATAVTINDALPAGDGVGWSISPAYGGPGTCAINGVVPAQVLSCTFGALGAGVTASVHITSATSFASCAPYDNTVSLAATNAPPLTASASTTVNCPGLTLVKTADDDNVNAGSPIGFTVTAHNAGPGTAAGASLNDALPSGPAVSWSVSPAYAGPGTCAITGAVGSQVLGCNFGALASGGTASVHVTSGTAFAGCKTYPNTASLSATNAPSIEASATTIVNCADLHLVKTADDATVNAGSAIGFTVMASNSGAGTATAAALNDPLPAGNGVSWSISPAYGGQGSCDIVGAVGSQVLSCDFGDLLGGSSASVHVTSATVFASCTVYPNSASLSASNHPTVTADASVTVNCPNLSVTKTADAAQVNAGSPIGFTITAGNGGPGVATAAALSDPLPAGSGVSWSISPADSGPGTCDIAGAVGSQVLSCAFGDLAALSTAAVHVQSDTVFASCTVYPNTASLSASNAPDVTATAITTVNCPDLTLTKTADASPVDAGTSIGFTVLANNAGPGTATAAGISDPLPSGVGINWSITPAYGGPGTCVINGAVGGQTLDCAFGDLVSDSSASVHVQSDTPVDTCGSLVNVATLAATNAPSQTATASITVNCLSSLTVLKADAGTQAPLAGGQFDLVRDGNDNGIFNAGVDPVGASCTTDDTGVCTIDGLPFGTYWWVETVAPTGYTLPDNPVQGPITINAENAGTEFPVTTFDDTQIIVNPPPPPPVVPPVVNPPAPPPVVHVVNAPQALPNTGAGPVTRNVIWGFGLVLLGGLLLVMPRRRRVRDRI